MRLKNLSDAELAETYRQAIGSLDTDRDYLEQLEGEIVRRWLYEQGVTI